jgi:hypothetical protein
MDHYTQTELTALQKSGKSPAEIAEAKKGMDEMMAMYNTWPGLIGMTLLEILPVGILISLISAFVFKRKPAVDVERPQFA